MEACGQNINSLIESCERELEDRGYNTYSCRRIIRHWNEFALWMEDNEINDFTQETGAQFCRESFGTEVFEGVAKQERARFRAIRMLISYNRDGCFEFRAPLVAPRVFRGETGIVMEGFLDHVRQAGRLKDSAFYQKRLRLYEFNEYLVASSICLENITTQTLVEFCADQNHSLSKKHHFNTAARQFLRYAFDVGATAVDLSFVVMPDNYKSHRKLPSVYEEDEIRQMLQSAERASAIGKRDYLVLLLASEYGWRSSDIVNFSFDRIDWDKNTIRFEQQKTGTAVEYPLLSSIGNAIIDYLENGRPDTCAPEIIVAHDTLNRGKKLKTPTIHSIVARHLRAANIVDWDKKKHGPHSLRHSLASNLLKKNVSMPMIATILGHQSTETTKIYLSLDIEQLRKCALAMPPLTTKAFEVAL